MLHETPPFPLEFEETPAAGTRRGEKAGEQPHSRKSASHPMTNRTAAFGTRRQKPCSTPRPVQVLNRGASFITLAEEAVKEELTIRIASSSSGEDGILSLPYLRSSLVLLRVRSRSAGRSSYPHSRLCKASAPELHPQPEKRDSSCENMRGLGATLGCARPRRTAAGFVAHSRKAGYQYTTGELTTAIDGRLNARKSCDI